MTRSQGSPGRAELKRTASGLDVEEGTKGLLEDTLPRGEENFLANLQKIRGVDPNSSADI